MITGNIAKQPLSRAAVITVTAASISDAAYATLQELLFIMVINRPVIGGEHMLDWLEMQLPVSDLNEGSQLR